MQERRYYKRKLVNARVRLYHANFDVVEGSTRDISDGGVFVVVEEDDFKPELGDVVTVQVQGLPVPAPELRMVVVRQSVDGFGLQFADH